MPPCVTPGREFHPHRRELLGPDRTLRWHLDDVDGADGTWLVDLTGTRMVHRPADVTTRAAVTARGYALDVLLVLYRRRPPDHVTIEGDRDLLDEWLDASGFA